MICSGKVLTINGYKNINDLKINDSIIDYNFNNILVTDIIKKETDKYIKFNNDVELSIDTIFNSAFGKNTIDNISKENIIYIYDINRVLNEYHYEIINEKKQVYDIKTLNNKKFNVFVDGINIFLGENNA